MLKMQFVFKKVCTFSVFLYVKLYAFEVIKYYKLQRNQKVEYYRGILTEQKTVVKYISKPIHEKASS